MEEKLLRSIFSHYEREWEQKVKDGTDTPQAAEQVKFAMAAALNSLRSVEAESLFDNDGFY